MKWKPICATKHSFIRSKRSKHTRLVDNFPHKNFKDILFTSFILIKHPNQRTSLSEHMFPHIKTTRVQNFLFTEQRHKHSMVYYQLQTFDWGSRFYAGLTPRITKKVGFLMNLIQFDIKAIGGVRVKIFILSYFKELHKGEQRLFTECQK